MNRVDALQMLKSYLEHGFSPIPLEPQSKVPLVKWKKYHLTNEELLRFLSQDANWAIRCDEHFHALDFDNPDIYQMFIWENAQLLKDAPTIRTSRGYHVWFKPRKPVKSFTGNGIEVKGLGSIVVVPPSIHPSGARYEFEKPLNGKLPEIDIAELLGYGPNQVSTAKGAAPDVVPHRHSSLPHSTTAEQEEFRSLFAQLGVFPGENPTWCPFHPDREGLPGSPPQKSLSVDWEKCVFKCHSPRCGEHGGFGRLRRLELGGDDCQSYSMSDDNTKTNSDIPIPEPPPWDSWDTVELPTKRCGMPIHLRHRRDKRRQRIIGVLCGRWDCATCGPYLKEMWLKHLTPLIMDAETVHLIVVSKKEWPRVYRRIRRAGGDFARVELNDGPFAVFNTAGEGTMLPCSIRLGVLKAAVDAATFHHKAITTSRGWKLPEEKEEESEWERIGGLPVTVAEAKEVVKELGLKPIDLVSYRLMSNIGEAFEVVLPESWLEDDERGFKVFVKWLSHGPVKSRDAPRREALEMFTK